MLGSGNRNRRLIYTDGRKQVGQVDGNDDNPLFYGQAVAHWKATRCVVDTRCSTRSSGSITAGCRTPSSSTWSSASPGLDLGTMRYEATIDDPGAYTRHVEEQLGSEVGPWRRDALFPLSGQPSLRLMS